MCLIFLLALCEFSILRRKWKITEFFLDYTIVHPIFNYYTWKNSLFLCAYLNISWITGNNSQRSLRFHAQQKITNISCLGIFAPCSRTDFFCLLHSGNEITAGPQACVVFVASVFHLKRWGMYYFLFCFCSFLSPLSLSFPSYTLTPKFHPLSSSSLIFPPPHSPIILSFLHLYHLIYLL